MSQTYRNDVTTIVLFLVSRCRTCYEYCLLSKFNVFAIWWLNVVLWVTSMELALLCNQPGNCRQVTSVGLWLQGCRSPLVVKFADTQKDKEMKKLQQMNTNLLGTLTGGAPVNNMGGLTPQYLAVSICLCLHHLPLTVYSLLRVAACILLCYHVLSIAFSSTTSATSVYLLTKSWSLPSPATSSIHQQPPCLFYHIEFLSTYNIPEPHHSSFIVHQLWTTYPSLFIKYFLHQR